MPIDTANDEQVNDPLQHAIRLLGVLHAWYRDPNPCNGNDPHRLDSLYPGNQQKRNTGYYGNTDPLWLQVEKLINPPT